jgi:hypothetical protein
MDWVLLIGGVGLFLLFLCYISLRSLKKEMLTLKSQMSDSEAKGDDLEIWSRKIYAWIRDR